jgi:ssDNA thymidine ADP-ribosyltransferase, DarT
MSQPPANPKIYHIVHLDRLPSILAAGFLFSDADMANKPNTGTTIGMANIKQARLTKPLVCYPDLNVGYCVPFYFCPRSVMLYQIHKRNPELSYTGGQEPIIHLEADMNKAIIWAEQQGLRWVFTDRNARITYAMDYIKLEQLEEINWKAVETWRWGDGYADEPQTKEMKQAEFLIEKQFPWSLFNRIGVLNQKVGTYVTQALNGQPHRPIVEVLPGWYY